MRMIVGIAAAAYLSVINWSVADTTFTAITDVTIEDASLEREDDGAYHLRFRLINDSPAEIMLIGVGSIAAENGQLIYYSSHSSSEPIETLTLQPDEELDFSTSHQRALLTGLKIDGGKAPFHLLFQRGRIDSEAHVHGK